MTVIAVLLTFCSGATDVASFTRLGDVFASVMTGNIVLFGLSLARGSVSLASHTAVAFAGYVIGVAAGTRVAWFHATRVTGGSGADGSGADGSGADGSGADGSGADGSGADGSGADGSPWPPHITLALLIEFLLMAGAAAGWEATGSDPTGVVQFVMLAAISCAMGIQAAAVTDMSLKEISTTYLTGTLTGWVGALARPGHRAGFRRPGVLLGLVFGAVLAGVLVAYAPDLVPALPLAAIIAVILLGSGHGSAWLSRLGTSRTKGPLPEPLIPDPRRPR
jgi:uncharacterized membrane protein YoaK (UPF0700 family)